MSTPKVHHYVPQFYLRGFLDASAPPPQEKLWAYDKLTGEVKAKGPKHVAAQNGYYTLTKEDGADNLELEQWLSDVESHGAAVLAKIREGTPLSSEDRQLFSIFVAALLLRVPNYRDSFKTGEEAFFRSIVEPFPEDPWSYPVFVDRSELAISPGNALLSYSAGLR